ncbi:hypothetical protein KR026_009949, partial [Drosophila bipectinata]
ISRWLDKLSNKLLLFWLRFYFRNFNILGLMGLEFDDSQKKVQLTYYSVAVARILGVILVYGQCYIICNHFNNSPSVQPLAFICCLLIQPRIVFEKRIRIINRFIKISRHYFYQQKFEVPWSLPISLFIKSNVYPLDLLNLVENLDIFETPIKIFSTWIIYITTDVLGMGLSMLVNYFDMINAEISEITKKLPSAILRKDTKILKSLEKRLIFLRKMHQSCTVITQYVFDCFGVQLLLLVYSNMSFLSSFSFGSFLTSFDSTTLCMSLRSFILSLDDLWTKGFIWQGIPWWHMAHLYQFEELLREFQWQERSQYIRKDIDWANELHNQCLMHHILKPRFQVLGMFTPNRKLLLRVIFTLSSIHY